jgi:pyridoxine 5-phosphate synthase
LVVIALSVNLNKIALLRNSREGDLPSVVDAAETVVRAGAYGITVHPRPDQRHVRPHDVTDLCALLRSRHPGIEFNVEGNPFAPARANGYPGFDALIEAASPDQCTLVPDSDDQLTSDHGWDLSGETTRLKQSIERCHRVGARVSLFMDPSPAQIERVAATGADRIELYTGPFAETVRVNGLDHPATRACYDTFARAARQAAGLGLGVNAGHDLDLVNLKLFRNIKEVLEVSIGHALIGDALTMGLAAAVTAYLAVLAG